jgi:hypothetical protein
MAAMNSGFWKLIIVLCVVGGFFVLSSYSWAITHAPHRHIMEDRVKPVTIWRTHKAALLADVYGLTPEEVNRPIGIWGKR